jgi:hypothetical protein
MEVPISYRLTFYPKQTYLHVIVTGRNSKENVESYLKEVLYKCKSSNYSRVLIEEHLEGPRLKTLDVFQIASEGSAFSQGMLKSIAYVDINAEDDLMKFAETVAVNRSSPIRVFSTVPDAEKWLLDKDRMAGKV